MAIGLAGLLKAGAIGTTLVVAGAITLAGQVLRGEPSQERPRLTAAEVGLIPVAARRDPGIAIPVEGVGRDALSDTFDQARSEGRRHDAIDIMAPRGTPVTAAADGRIERLFSSRAGGNTIYLRLPDGATIHYYAHLDGYAPHLHEGETVHRGDTLGTVGSTGNASPAAPHLHFAILDARGKRWWEAVRAINPYPLLVGK